MRATLEYLNILKNYINFYWHSGPIIPRHNKLVCFVNSKLFYTSLASKGGGVKGFGLIQGCTPMKAGNTN
jgi:hypothetical protein